MAGTEVERKWLVPDAPAEALAAASEPIAQGYLTVGGDGGETRVRRRGERCFLTVKSGSGLVRSEHEVELTPDQFEALWPATEGARLVKRRHLLRGDEGSTIELDVYEDRLSGLVVAEVEFDDVQAARSFAPPEWFGPEVTDDPEYRNQRLALRREPPAPMSP
jgi:CYTH domain-containing protein